MLPSEWLQTPLPWSTPHARGLTRVLWRLYQLGLHHPRCMEPVHSPCFAPEAALTLALACSDCDWVSVKLCKVMLISMSACLTVCETPLAAMHAHAVNKLQTLYEDWMVSQYFNKSWTYFQAVLIVRILRF